MMLGRDLVYDAALRPSARDDLLFHLDERRSSEALRSVRARPATEMSFSLIKSMFATLRPHLLIESQLSILYVVLANSRLRRPRSLRREIFFAHHLDWHGGRVEIRRRGSR